MSIDGSYTMATLKVNIGNILKITSLIPLAFLLYTLTNLSALNITVTHPRVIVEFSLFLIFLTAGLYLKYDSFKL